MKIEREDDFGGAVLNCAVRYALGRMSYMPGLVMDVIRPMLKIAATRPCGASTGTSRNGLKGENMGLLTTARNGSGSRMMFER